MARLIVSGGGTGGHIYPALAIADGVMQRWPGTDILYVGARAGMESRIVEETGYPFRGISAEGWQGRKATTLVAALRADAKGTREAMGLFAAFRPDAVVGTGGFVCLPVGLAAARKRIPLFLHEQNAMPGLTNRLVSIRAKRVMVSFEEAVGRFPAVSRKKTAVTGLPVRASITAADRGDALAYFQLNHGKKTILVAGGSQGAQRINRAMLHVMGKLYQRQGVQILFATGHRDYRQMAEELAGVGMEWEIAAGGKSNIRMFPYIDRMDLAYAAAQIFVGRAGASTLAEITLSKLPAILVPYPQATENHQTFNAASLMDRGGALLLEDETLTGPVLLAALEGLLADEGRRAAMAACSGQASYARALEDILDILTEVMV